MKGLKIGDVVYLKSGGPLMTVVSRSTLNNSSVGLAWFTNELSKQNIEFTNLDEGCLTDDDSDPMPGGRIMRGR